MKRIFIFLFLIFVNLNAIEITLELKGAHNIKDEQTGEIVPAIYENELFRIIAVVNGGGRNSSELEIKDLDKLTSSGLTQKQVSVSDFNNSLSSNIHYIYGFIAGELGEFEIGPAKVSQGGQSFESNKLFFKVIKKGEGSPVNSSIVQDNKKYELFCKLEADKLNVVEGEPVELSLKIYRRGKVLQMGIHPVEFPGFEVKEIEDPINSQEDIQGKVYSVLEKKYILFPLEPGIKKIESIHVSFNVPAKRRVRGFGTFDAFDDLAAIFGPSTKTFRAVSNSLRVNVESLSGDNRNIDGLGTFSRFEMSVDKDDVILNEPILLTLEVAGIGNLDQIVAPKLNLPESFTYYQSKTKIEREERVSYLAGKKIFEYIVQVGKPGQHQVESQLFVYFDTDSKTYKTLRSNSIFLNIKNPPEQQSLSHDDNFDVKSNKELVTKDYEEDINFIEEDATFLIKQTRTELPVVWFLILLVFPLIIYFKISFTKLFKRLFPCFFIKNISAKFEKDLDLIINEKKVSSLYKFFVSYFSSRFNLEKNNVNEDWIENKLLDLDWSKEKVDEFLSYLHLCASLSFAAYSKDYLDQGKLLGKSKYWFFMLESKK